jgi:hypothetical protein
VVNFSKVNIRGSASGFKSMVCGGFDGAIIFTLREHPTLMKALE